MTKQKAVEILDIVSFDYAIPEQFHQEMSKIIDCPLSHFVWSYDGDSIFGYPRPLTEKGRIALIDYNRKYNTLYETELEVLFI